MSTLATLVVKLTADSGDFRRDMEKSSGMVSRFTSGFGKNVQTLGKVAVAGIGIAAGAAVAGGVALTKFALDAAELQTIEAAFQGIAAESEGGADAMLAALKRGSAGMVAQKDLMLTYNKAAQLVGTTFANQLPDAMQYLQKVSAATGQDMGFLLDSLTVGVGRLSPMILDNLAIQVSLSEASERAAEMFGVEAKELTKAQQQAGMMNVVLEKLQKNTEAMPDVSNSAAAGIARMQARWQDTKDTLGKAFLPVLVTVMGVITKLADKIIPVVVEWVGRLSNAVNYIMRGFTMFEWTISDFFETADDGTTRIGTFLNMLGLGEETADAVGRAINNVAQTIMNLIETIKPYVEQAWAWIQQNVELKDVLIAMGIAIASVVIPAIIGIVMAALPLIATAVALIAIVALVRKAWETDWGGIRTFVNNTITAIRKWWEENGEAILAKARDVYETVRKTIEKAMAKIRDIIDASLAAIRNWWAENGEAVMAKAREIYETVRQVIDTAMVIIRNIINTVLELIRGFWNTHGEQIKQIVSDFMTLVQTTIETIINVIQTIVETILNALRDFWDAHGQAIIELADAAWTTIKDIIDSLLDIIQGIIQAATALIKGDWETFGQALQDIWDAAWKAVKSIIENVIPAIINLIGGLVTDIWNKITSVDWGKLGKAIINGIADGVRAAAGALARAALQAAKDALEAVRRWLKIDSPSRVFFEQVGRPMIEGWAMGVADTRPLERAIADVAARSFAVSAQLTPTSPGMGNTFQLTAQYAYQEERTLAQDVRFLQLLYGK